MLLFSFLTKVDDTINPQAVLALYFVNSNVNEAATFILVKDVTPMALLLCLS